MVRFVSRSSDHVRSPDHPILTPLCLRPSARDPTPHRALLKTNAKVQFERPVKRLSRPFFLVSESSNRGQFQPCFSLFTVRSAEGRKTSLRFWLNAECRVLIAKFSKIPHRIAAPRWEENDLLYYLFAYKVKRIVTRSAKNSVPGNSLSATEAFPLTTCHPEPEQSVAA